MNSEYILPFHNCFLLKPMNGAQVFNMNPKIQELRKKMDKLEKEAKELKSLRSDYVTAKQFRSMILKQDVD